MASLDRPQNDGDPVHRVSGPSIVVDKAGSSASRKARLRRAEELGGKWRKNFRNGMSRCEIETRFFPIDRRYPRTRYRSSRTFYIAQPWPVSHWTVVAPFSARTRSRGSVRRHQIPIRYALHFRGNYVFITAIGSVETNGSLWTGWLSGRMVENDIASRCSDGYRIGEND